MSGEIKFDRVLSAREIASCMTSKLWELASTNHSVTLYATPSAESGAILVENYPRLDGFFRGARFESVQAAKDAWNAYAETTRV